MEQRPSYQRGYGLPRRPRFNYASALRRIGAYIIDIILLLILNLLLFSVFFFFGIVSWEMLIETDAMFLGFYTASYLVFIAISGIIDLVYFTILESKKGWGATIGKRVLDIKVIDGYGRKIDLGTSFIRNIVRLLWQIPCIGFIILIIDVVLIADSDQRIGDRLASTYVVKEKNVPRDYSDYGTFQNYSQQRQWDRGRSSQQTSSSPESDKIESHSTPIQEDQNPKTDSSRCPRCGYYSLVKNEDGGKSCIDCKYES